MFSIFFLEMFVILKQNRKSKSRKISIEDSGLFTRSWIYEIKGAFKTSKNYIAAVVLQIYERIVSSETPTSTFLQNSFKQDLSQHFDCFFFFSSLLVKLLIICLKWVGCF